jgi:hypothetical protein
MFIGCGRRREHLIYENKKGGVVSSLSLYAHFNSIITLFISIMVFGYVV